MTALFSFAAAWRLCLKVGVFTNLHKDSDLSVTKALLSSLEARKISFVLDDGLRDALPGYEYFSLDQTISLDFMVTVGGDGTILRIAKFCALQNIPIAGLNLGHVGFLTVEEPNRVQNMVDALISNEYKLEKRTLLSANVLGNEYFALNDVVVSREFSSRMLNVDVRVNGELVDRYFCDGYIVSTPTGSTAYSLSAGGPIVSPNVGAFILTSLNSHTLHARPIVVAEDDLIELELDKRGEVSLVVDGEPALKLSGAVIKLKKSKYSVSLVRLDGHGFYKKLLTKLNKWSLSE